MKVVSSFLVWIAAVAAAGSSLASPTSSALVSTGLRNLGNTCYLNAQMQCAFHIPRVRSLVLSPQQRQPPTTTPDDKNDSETVCTEPSEMDGSDITGEELSTVNDDENENDNPNAEEAEEEEEMEEEESIGLQAVRLLFRDMINSADASTPSYPAAPSALCQVLGIPVMEQQDSQEFWKLLLPAMECPALVDLYSGAFEDYIVAADGSNRERRREEAFLDLSLDIKTPTSPTTTMEPKSTLLASLKHLFGAPERLSVASGNGWRPAKGEDKVDADKGSLLRVQGLPSILQLHLKRFNYDWNTGTTHKLNQPLEFPAVLDLSSVVVEDEEESDVSARCQYDLQAVVVHAGQYGVGHYYSYVRPDLKDKSNAWYRFNDDEVTAVSWTDVYNDAVGGKVNAATTEPKRKGFALPMWLTRVFQPRFHYGYGGSTSNAYVLQYVRRSDIPALYGGNEETATACVVSDDDDEEGSEQ